ncbi:hypothetical protein D3C73_1234160 [compost metagenome]
MAVARRGRRGITRPRGHRDQHARQCKQAAKRGRKKSGSHVAQRANVIVGAAVYRPQPDQDHQRTAVVVLPVDIFLHLLPPSGCRTVLALDAPLDTSLARSLTTNRSADYEGKLLIRFLCAVAFLNPGVIPDRKDLRKGEEKKKFESQTAYCSPFKSTSTGRGYCETVGANGSHSTDAKPTPPCALGSPSRNSISPSLRRA